MKKISILLSLVVVLFSCSGNSQNQIKRYQVESGSIEYNTKISGKVMGSNITGSGTEVRYFKNWGALELHEQNSTTNTHVVVMGREINETTSDHQMSKLDNGKTYSVNFKNKTISETNDMAMEMIKKMHPNADAGEVGKSMLEGMGGKQVGKEDFLGYSCEIWDLLGIKQWIYKGVMLKSEATLMGITTITEATKATFNKSVPDSKFQLPNYPINKVESFAVDNGDVDFDMNDMENIDAEMKKLSKLTFEEWKEMVTENDSEMKEMSDEELRQSYNMMQQMMKLKKGN